MKRQWTIVAAGLLLAATTAATAQPRWPAVTNETKAGSRWWWMGSAVDEEGLKWNMEQLARAGIGTLEITPIYGVKGQAQKNIGYLTPQWLGMLKYAKEQGRQLGIDIDMTTGTGWPFGGPMVKVAESAGKLVTEDTKLTGDGSRELTVTLGGSGVLQRVLAFPQEAGGGAPTDLTPLVDGKRVRWTAPAGQWRVIAVYCQQGVMDVKRPAPGSEGLVLDHFDREAVSNYLGWFDQHFQDAPGAMPRTFFNDSYEITTADWTRRMFEEFQKYRGYRLEDVMDKLIDKDPQVLADYRQTLSDMLLHNFTEPWTQWAHSHGATTRNQAHGSPGNLIDLYAAADIPETESFYLSDFGISGLRRDDGFTLKALSTLPTLKYASSAAHITGRRLVSSESMTWLTEHFRTSLAQMKPEIDQLFVSGVNRVMFHGTTYSPPQAEWPGWKFYAAVDMSPTNSIWRDAPELLKYIERTQSFLQMGSPDNDLLVYAPFTSAMHKTSGAFANRLLLFDINNMDTRMSELARCVGAIEAAGLDCDYTSERYLMTTTYADGCLQTAAGTRYRALVVPVKDHMADSVKNHLDALQAQGARIVYDYSAETLAALGIKGEALRTDMGLKVIRRRNDTGYHYFIANLSAADAEGYAALAVPFASVVAYDPMTGEMGDATVSDGSVYVSLKSGQSVILQTYDTATTAGTAMAPTHPVGRLTIDGRWRLSFTDDSYPQMAGKSYELDGRQTWEHIDEMTAQLMGTGIYETTFTLTPQQVATATAGFRLDLGDVRESARVWLNDVYLGCAWAVPYSLSCQGAVKAGTNTLRVEVTNLPANRIRQMDIDGKEWRIFEDTNINTISGSTTYKNWAPVASGLNSTVSLVPLAVASQAMTASLKEMRPTADGGYAPVYRLATLSGRPISTLHVADAEGRDFSGATFATAADGTAELTVSGTAEGDVIVRAADDAGTSYYAYLPARGTYSRDISIDFTAGAEPAGGWQLLASTSTIRGFEAEGKLPWYRSKSNGREVTLYDGVTFSSDKPNYYFYFTGYGMNTTNDFRATIAATDGDIAQLSYLVGAEGATAYTAADSLVSFTTCGTDDSAITLTMPASGSYYVYRSLAVYRPRTATGMAQPTLSGTLPATPPHSYYNLQGQRVERPAKGIYIRNGKKVAVR